MFFSKASICGLLTLLLGLPMQAQNRWLAEPLQYISPDSVYTWAYAGNNFRQTALLAEPQTAAMRFAAGSNVVAARDELLKQWQTLSAEFNIVGGGDNPLSDPQGIPSAIGTSLAAHLFLLTGEAGYVHFLERTVFNAAGRTLADTTLQAGNADRRSAAEVFMAVPSMIYATTPRRNELYVNLYTNATSTLHLGGQTFTFDQITNMPEDGSVKFRFSNLQHELPLKVHLRLPDWAVYPTERTTEVNMPYAFVDKAPKGLQVFVNGHEVDSVKPDAQGYLCIDRTWQNHDEIYIEFPFTPRFLRRTLPNGTAQRGELALQFGPQVYVVTPAPAADTYFSVNALPTLSTESDEQGNLLLKGYGFSSNKSTPQDAEAARMPYVASPYVSGYKGAVWLPEYGK